MAIECCRCGYEIYPDEYYGVGQDGPVCRDCLDAEWRNLDDQTRYECLGMEVRGNVR